MSCPFPQEILDLVIDQLHDEPQTLKSCCIVSKVWIHRTQNHLFNHVRFQDRHFSQWRETFPDPLGSPAHNTRILSIGPTDPVTKVDTNTFLVFRGVSRLNVNTARQYDQELSLVPFHGLSPAIRSLNLSFSRISNSEIFGLICSLPLLEDLPLLCRGLRNRYGVWTVPPTSSRLTGSLELRMVGIQTITSGLLDLPGCLCCKRIAVEWIFPGDVGSTMDLVSRCSDTLESLEITDSLTESTSRTTPLDFSNAKQLRDVEFICEKSDVRWITEVLRTAEIRNLKSVSVVVSHFVVLHASRLDAADLGWSNLDRLLVELWTLNSLRPRVTCRSRDGWRDPEGDVAKVLPESTRRGIVDLGEPAFVSRVE